MGMLASLLLLGCGGGDLSATANPAGEANPPDPDKTALADSNPELGATTETPGSASTEATPPPPSAIKVEPIKGPVNFPAPAEAGFASEDLMHVKLKEANDGYNLKGQFAIQGNKVLAANLAGTGVRDLAPLRGLPLIELDLQACPVTDLFHLKDMPLESLFLDLTQVYDLRPLAGMPLSKLYLTRTGVKNIAPLKGMRLTEFNAAHTPVQDLSVLAGMPIESLWLSHTAVTDISALAEVPLVSLTLHGTNVKDLTPLAKHPTLQRLHIGETAVTDLTPLQGLRLNRLIFPANQITKGLEIAQTMPLREIGTAFDDENDDRSSPAAFWAARKSKE